MAIGGGGVRCADERTKELLEGETIFYLNQRSCSKYSFLGTFRTDFKGIIN